MCRGSGGSRGLAKRVQPALHTDPWGAGDYAQVLPCLCGSIPAQECSHTSGGHPTAWPGTLAAGCLCFVLLLGVSARKKSTQNPLGGGQHGEAVAECSPVPSHLVLPPLICK